jgi:hypothetical protein
LVVKDKLKTTFMQHAGMFEHNKFVGKVVEAKQDSSHWKLSLKKILERCNKDTTENFITVGIIIPDGKAYFLPDHNVYSNGTGWILVEDMCKACNAKLEKK